MIIIMEVIKYIFLLEYHRLSLNNISIIRVSQEDIVIELKIEIENHKERWQLESQ